MRQSTYRVLIATFGVWYALSLPAVLLPLFLPTGKPLDAPAILLPIGIALLPISAIGLWHLRLWGFISLVVGFILVMAIYPRGSSFHGICIALTILRYGYARREATINRTVN